MIDSEIQSENNYSSSNIELTPEEWIQLCELRPDAFAHHYFGHVLRLKSSRLHHLLYTLIADLCKKPEDQHHVVAAPRGNAKTMIISVILPIWCIVLKKKNFIFLVSSTSRIAEQNLESIQHELMTNEELKEDFPEACGEGPVWRKEMIQTNNGVRVSALGAGKQLRGHLLKGGVRPDLVINDDIDSEKNVSTIEQRDKHENWFTKDLMGMKGAGQKMDVLVVGTVIHAKSLVANLLDPKRYPGWKKHLFKAVYHFSESEKWMEWETMYKDYTREDPIEEAKQFYEENKEEMLKGTEVLWPEGDDYYSLMEWRLNMGIRAFSSEKMNNPLDPSLKTFDTTILKYFDEDDVAGNLNLDFYGSFDPASGTAKRIGDRSAIITLAKDRKTGVMYVIDAYIKHMQISECIEYIKQMHRKYNYRKFGVDSDALKLLKDYIERDIPDLNLILYDLRLKKEYRIQRLEPDVRNGRIRFRRTQLKLLEELEMYPQTEYDDGLDALEIAVKSCSNRGYRLLTY